jgi:protocatechuate 3,4-dioxygenase beta subunit
MRATGAGVTAWMWNGNLWAACEAPTSASPEGPAYKPGAPERTSLYEPGMEGTRLTVAGTVMNSRCEPIPNAILDIWQVDHKGNYDTQGYRPRGKLLTDSKGRYEIRTIVPPAYPAGANFMRAAHIHLKLSAQGTPLFTTELYFEGDPHGKTDRMWKQPLALRLKDGLNGSKLAEFDFRLKQAL